MTPATGEARYRALLGDPNLVKGGRIDPLWLEGGACLAYVERAGPAPEVILREAATGRMRWRLDPATLHAAASPVALAADPDGGLRLTTGGEHWALDLTTGAAERLEPAAVAALSRRAPRPTRAAYPTTLPPEMEVPSPDGAWLLTLEDHDVWVRPSADGAPRRLTSGGGGDPRWSTDHAAWSPDGRFVALMRVDDRAVARVPLVDWSADEATVSRAPYPRADGAIQIREVHLIEVASGDVRRLGGGDPGHYAFILGFSADSRRLRYARLDRRARSVEILEHDLATAADRTLLAETSPSFLYWTPTFILQGPPIQFLADGRFLWQSERSGWNQIYLYDADGRAVRALTEGDYPVSGLVAVDEAAERLFYRAQPNPRRPYDTQLFRAAFDGTRVQLSAGPGVHEAYPAPDVAHYVEISSAPDRPPAAALHAADGRRIVSLSRADASGLKALGWRPPEPFTAKAADGESELHGLIDLPADFDPQRRYPVIEHIYAGGQTIHTAHAFGPGAASAFAQLGFVVVTLDGRGTPGRGKAFQDVVRGLGDFEIADHAGALRQAAATRPWMDLSRVGIFGLSFGGYFTIRALIQAPDLYRAGVALAPAELGPGIMTMPVEAYIGLPRDDPARYQAIRNTDKLQAIAGELLIITGTDDVNTPLGQTMAYVRGLIAAGKAFDQMVIPNVNHLFVDPAGRPEIAAVYGAVMRHFQRTLARVGAIG